MLFFKRPQTSRINEVDLEEVHRRVPGIRAADETPTNRIDLPTTANVAAFRQRPHLTGEPEPERVMPDQVPTTGVIQWE